jgi:large subunit ribosomal protein L18
MRNSLIKEQKRRKSRAMRVRKRLRGTSLKPRLSVHKSNSHIQVQLIDDEKSLTIGGTSTFATEFKNTEFCKKNKESARKLGEWIAEFAKKNDISEVVFDRGPFKYHGILAELANAARASGLQF